VKTSSSGLSFPPCKQWDKEQVSVVMCVHPYDTENRQTYSSSTSKKLSLPASKECLHMLEHFSHPNLSVIMYRENKPNVVV
jgi:hypothetical protein